MQRSTTSFIITAVLLLASPALLAQALPPGWLDADIGDVGLPGSAEADGSTFTVHSSGAQIFGTADGFHFVYRPLIGDGAIEARVPIPAPQGSAVGLMIRDSLAADAAHATSFRGNSGSVGLRFRDATGRQTHQVRGSRITGPVWLRIERQGSWFTSSYSLDGTTWSEIASQEIAMPEQVWIGLAVAAGSTETMITTAFEGVSVDAAPEPAVVSFEPLSLLLTDIGDQGSLTATVFDENGGVLPNAEVEWEVADPDALSLLAMGSEATFEALTPVGFSKVTARSGAASTSTYVVVARLHPSTRVLEPEWVLDRQEVDGSLRLILERNGATELIGPGDFLVLSGVTEELLGLLAAVEAVDVLANEVRVVYELASLDEPFEEMRFTVEAEAETVLPWEQDEDVVLDESTPSESSLPPVKAATRSCKVSFSGPSTVQLSLARISGIPLDADLSVSVDVHEDHTDVFFGSTLDSDFTIRGPTISGTVAGGGSYGCTWEWPKIPLPPIPVAGIVLAPKLAPEFGISGGFATTYASFDYKAPDFHFEANGLVGLGYDGLNDELYKVNEFQVVDQSSEVYPITGFDVDYSTDIVSSVSVSGRLGLGLHVGIVGFPLADLSLLKGSAGVGGSLGLPHAALVYPVPPPNPDHRDPTWGVSAFADLSFDIGIDYVDALKYLAKDANPSVLDIDLSLLSYSLPLGGTGDFALLVDATEVGPGAQVPLRLEHRELSLLERAVYEGRDVEFWASEGGVWAPVGATTVTPEGGETVTWTVAGAGPYQVAAIVYDRLLGALPYPVPYLTDLVDPDGSGGSGSFTVDFDVDPRAGDAPLTTRLSWEVTYSGNRPFSCSLDPGDGSPVEALDGCQVGYLTHHYESPGSYEALFQVGDGLVAEQRSLRVYVVSGGNDVEITAFDADPANGAFPLATAFSWQVASSGSAPVTCTLDPGDGSPAYVFEDCAGASGQAHIYGESGRYVAVLVAEDPTSGDAATLRIGSPRELWPAKLHDVAATAFNGREGKLQPPLQVERRFDPPPGYDYWYVPPLVAEDLLYTVATRADRENSLLRAHRIETGELAWEKTLPGWSIYSDPVLSGGVIYVPVDLDHVYGRATIYALNAEDGQVIWASPLLLEPQAPSPGGLEIAVDAQRVYATYHLSFGYPDDEGRVRALDRESGETLWESGFSTDVGPPTAVDGVVAVAGIDRNEFPDRPFIGALDASTGAHLWSLDLELRTWDWDPAGDRERGHLIVPFVDDPLGPDVFYGLRSLDVHTGATVWSLDYWVESANPVLVGDSVYHAGSFPWKLYRVDAATGQVQWETFIPNVPGDYVYFTAANGFLFAVSGVVDDPRIRAFDAETGLLVWESEERGDPYPQSLPLVPAAGRLFVFDDGGSWLAYAPVP